MSPHSLTAADQPVPAGQAIPAMRPVSGLRGADLEAAIGRLVREALEHQLGLAGPATPPTPAAPPAAVGRQRISDSVVSLRTLESLPEGTAGVEVGSRAVLTPAAADLLRQRGVEVVRGELARDPSKSAAVPAADGGCWIADADHPERVAGYVRQLAGRGLAAASVELPRTSADDFRGAVGVVVAELPAIHVDRFARGLSLPAVAVGSLSEVARIAAAMSPAVWVLDAERLSFSGRVAVAAECFRLSQIQTAAARRPR